MNHWIALAKAAIDHADGRQHQGVLGRCRAARAAGAALFPLSSIHYFELYKIRNHQQRAHLTAVMEELSGFTSLLSRSFVVRLELDTALSMRFGSEGSRMLPLPLLGHGVAWAFGFKGIRVTRSGQDVTAEFQEANPDVFRQAREDLERRLLAGPAGADLTDLTSKGWDPTAITAVTEKRAQQERDQAERFRQHSEFPKHQLGDAVLAREMIIEWEELIMEALAARRVPFRDVVTAREALRHIMLSMPSFTVAVELKTAGHRNLQRLWSANDIHDIDALSLAVPYCDIVVTDKHACNAVCSAHLDQRLNTVVLSRLSELPDLQSRS